MNNDLMITNINVLKNIMYTFTRIRLERELSFYYQKVLQTSPKNVVSTDSFFDKLKKNTSNLWNNSTYEKYTKKRRSLEFFIDHFVNQNTDCIYYTKYEIKNKISEIFKDDIYGLAKLELVMNIVLDDVYEF